MVDTYFKLSQLDIIKVNSVDNGVYAKPFPFIRRFQMEIRIPTSPMSITEFDNVFAAALADKAMSVTPIVTAMVGSAPMLRGTANLVNKLTANVNPITDAYAYAIESMGASELSNNGTSGQFLKDMEKHQYDLDEVDGRVFVYNNDDGHQEVDFIRNRSNHCVGAYVTYKLDLSKDKNFAKLYSKAYSYYNTSLNKSVFDKRVSAIHKDGVKSNYRALRTCTGFSIKHRTTEKNAKGDAIKVEINMHLSQSGLQMDSVLYFAPKHN